MESGPPAGSEVRGRVAEAFRLEYGRVVASVLRIVRDIDTAEEAARADFLRRLGRWSEAAAAYRLVLAGAGNASEQRFLSARLTLCESHLRADS